MTLGASRINDLCYELFKASEDGMLLVDAQERITDANPEAFRLLGWTRDQLVGSGISKVTGPSYPLLRDARGRYYHGILRAHVSLLRGDGTSFLAEVRIIGRRDGEMGILFRDLTAREGAEEALRESKELYRTVVGQAAEKIFIVDVGTKVILEANAALYDSLGYTAEELARLTLYDIVAHDRDSVDLNTRRIVESGRRFLGERQYRHKDGSLVDVEVNVSPILYGGREAMCVVAHDITDRRKAEESLRRSVEVLRAHYEAVQIMGSTLESEEVIARLLEIMRRVSNLTTTVISLRNDDGRVRVWRADGLEKLWSRARYSPEAEAARLAALERGEQRLFHVRHPDSKGEYLTGLCMPFLVRNRGAGVLEAYGSEDLAHGELTAVIDSLTSQAASALENAILYQDLAEREQRLKELVGQLLQTQEEERRRVAYEVHDGLAQVATAAHQRLQTYALRYAPDSSNAEEELDLVVRLVHQTVGEARRIIGDLRPAALDDFGLAVALSQTVDQLRSEGWSVNYELKLGNKRQPAAIETAVFRVAQEALTNVRKHARTGEVYVELLQTNGSLRLRVRDEGQGFDPGTLNTGGPGERVGVAGMRERIALLGGSFELWSRPNEGALVSVDVPLPAAEEEGRHGG